MLQSIPYFSELDLNSVKILFRAQDIKHIICKNNTKLSGLKETVKVFLYYPREISHCLTPWSTLEVTTWKRKILYFNIFETFLHNTKILHTWDIHCIVISILKNREQLFSDVDISHFGKTLHTEICPYCSSHPLLLVCHDPNMFCGFQGVKHEE